MPKKDPLSHNSKKGMDKFYSDPENLKALSSESMTMFYEEILTLCETKGIKLHKKRIFDVGCGAGHLLKMYKKRYNPKCLAGIELSSVAITEAKKRLPAAILLEGNICKSDIKRSIEEIRWQGQFDVIFCIEVMEHIRHPVRALKNCLDLVALKGFMIITVPDGRRDTLRHHINFWSPESWSIFLNDFAGNFECRTGLMEGGRTNYGILRRVG